MKAFIITSSVLVAALSAGVANAGNLWSINGASCTPDNGTATGGRWDNANGIVTFNGTTPGTINLYCPITAPISNPTSISMLHEHTVAGTTLSVSLYSITKSG